jgi:hypothetical protein
LTASIRLQKARHRLAKSLNDLTAQFPDYLPNPIPDTSALFTSNEFLDPEWLDVSEAQSEELAATGYRREWRWFAEVSTV